MLYLMFSSLSFSRKFAILWFLTQTLNAQMSLCASRQNIRSSMCWSQTSSTTASLQSCCERRKSSSALGGKCKLWEHMTAAFVQADKVLVYTLNKDPWGIVWPTHRPSAICIRLKSRFLICTLLLFKRCIRYTSSDIPCKELYRLSELSDPLIHPLHMKYRRALWFQFDFKPHEAAIKLI